MSDVGDAFKVAGTDISTGALAAAHAKPQEDATNRGGVPS